jgi:hypothetical protein
MNYLYSIEEKYIANLIEVFPSYIILSPLYIGLFPPYVEVFPPKFIRFPSSVIYLFLYIFSINSLIIISNLLLYVLLFFKSFNI